MKYLFETHSHTAEISPCSMVYAKDLVKMYKDEGYQGIIITDHVGDWGFSNILGSWDEKITQLVKAYDIAKAEGARLDISVLFGAEIALNNPYRDYLVYGFSASLLNKHPNIHHIDVDRLHEITRRENALLVAAHPFRGNQPMPDDIHLDGIEVFNGNPRQESNNDMAYQYAKKHKKLMMSGSDFHQVGDISGGVYLPSCPETIHDFVEMIQSGKYKLR